ncbi:hypothetical protein C1H46_032124 [Malus baccata]|uniref:Uncharacterized protein n=1 Tax=Malus baccata TaxID=106549 RepID=A0A540L769_MALBA|nr:hypothetical protein C1H46_032124 [Malus baccata]
MKEPGPLPFRSVTRKRNRYESECFDSYSLCTMDNFSKKPTAKEALWENKKEMTPATRGIENEIRALQLEEKKFVTKIKKTT